MASKAKASVYCNGKPRAIRRGNWRVNCRGWDHCVADIECFVELQKLKANTGFFLQLNTPEQCEYLADWLLKAAKFARSANRKRAANSSN